jgi:hypothetical protein
MEPTVGLEPMTHRLQGGSSTAELSWHQRSFRLLIYFVLLAVLNSFATLDFLLAAVCFFKTPTLQALSIYL